MQNKLRIEEWLFLAFIATLSFATFPQFMFLNYSIQVSDLLFLATFVIWTVLAALKYRKIRWSWLYLCLAGYALAVILSTIASADPARSSAKLLGKFYLISILFLAFNLIRSVDFLRTVLKAWMIGAGATIFLSLAGIILFYSGFTNPTLNLVIHPQYGSLPVGNYPRAEGFFEYPAMLCNFLSVTWMLGLLLASAGWLKNRVIWIFGAPLWIVNAFTLTPGLGGIFLGTGYFLYKNFKQKGRRLLSKAILVAAIFVAAGFLFVASVAFITYSPNGSEVPLANGDVAPSHRANVWRNAFATFLQSPILGRGVGEPTVKFWYTDPSGADQLLTDAHNTYISVLGETGLVGFVTFFSILTFVVFCAMRPGSGNGRVDLVISCLLIALGDAFVYQSLTGSYEDTRHLWLLFGIAAAVAAGDFRRLLTREFDHAESKNVST